MKYRIQLNEHDRQLLESLVHKNRHSERVLRRCRMLLAANDGETDISVAKREKCSINCVANLRKRFVTQGLQRALYDAPRSGAPQKFTTEQLDGIVELASGDPPPGKDRWTIELLCAEAARRGIVSSISVGRVFSLLKSRQSSVRSLDSFSSMRSSSVDAATMV